jgi:TonB family protein
VRRIVATLGLFLVVSASVWAQQAPRPDENGVYTAGKGLTPPKITSASAAVVPAGLAGVKHISTLTMVIGTDGIPSKIEVMNSQKSPLDDAAIAAVKQTQFEPGTSNDKPAPVRIFVWVPFVDADNPVVPETGPLNKIRNMTIPKVVNHVEARFSDEARRNHFSGTVELAVVVTESGFPSQVRIVVPLGMGLDEEAVKATQKYRFKPATLEGIAVPVPIEVQVNFRFYDR